ncbi:hypothetical protein D3C77_611930 [compost metagenome]
MVGNAGRYMSMANGPIAVSAPMRMSQPGRPLRETDDGDMVIAVKRRGQGAPAVIRQPCAKPATLSWAALQRSVGNFPIKSPTTRSCSEEKP